MALVTRLSRLFHADMNAVLDKIEEPELLLKQAIREMEETLYQKERHIKLLALEQQKLFQRENVIKQTINELDAQLKVCFDADNDDIARSLIKRKLETIQFLKSVSARKSNSIEKTNQLKNQLEEQFSQLSSMKQKADVFIQDNDAHSDSVEWSDYSFPIKDEDIEVALLDEKQKRKRS